MAPENATSTAKYILLLKVHEYLIRNIHTIHYNLKYHVVFVIDLFFGKVLVMILKCPKQVHQETDRFVVDILGLKNSE